MRPSASFAKLTGLPAKKPVNLTIVVLMVHVGDECFLGYTGLHLYTDIPIDHWLRDHTTVLTLNQAPIDGMGSKRMDLYDQENPTEQEPEPAEQEANPVFDSQALDSTRH